MQLNSVNNSVIYKSNAEIKQLSNLKKLTSISTQLQDYSISISKEGKLKSQYCKLLMNLASNEVEADDTINTNCLSSASVEDLIAKYGELYEKISKTMSEDEKEENLKALDDAFNYIAEQKAGVTGDSLDSFFDYAANNLSKYNMDTVDGIFESNTFKNNFNNLIIQAKNSFVKNLQSMGSQDSLKNALNFINSKTIDSLENIDIITAESISDMIKAGKSSSKDTLDVMLSMSKTFDKIIGKFDFTPDLKDRLKTAKSQNIKAYAKIKIYDEVTKENQGILDKIDKDLKNLNEIYDQMEEDLEKATDMNQKIRILRHESRIKKQIDRLQEERDGVQRNQNALKKDPDTIENNDKFKDVMNKYKVATMN